MRLASILKKYQDHHWVEEEASASIHIMDPWRICYLDWVDIFKNKNLYSFCFFLLDKNHLYEWSSFEESEKVLAWLLKTYGHNKKYLLTKDNEYQKVSKQIDDLFYFFRDTNINSLTNQELKKYLLELMDIGNTSFGYNLIAEAMDIVDENYYKKLLPKVPISKLLDVVSLLSTPDKLSFLEKENLDLLCIAKKYLKKDRSQRQQIFKDDMATHRYNYFWVQNNYKEARIIKLSYFKQSLNEILRTNKLLGINQKINYLKNKHQILNNRRQKIYSQYNISKQAKDFFALLRLLANWQDKRKENVQKILACVDKIFDRISREHKISKQVLREYFIAELVDVLMYGKRVSKTNLRKRRSILFYSYLDKNGRIKKEIFYGQNIFRAKKYFQRHNQVDINQGLSGFVASRGKGTNIVSGKVRIVLHAKGAKFKPGEILVTGMTRPEFVPLMKRAKAIITNEGGITTHAAIISRELKIPCIIGTKVATEVFKTGDRVELDLNNGIIKKL